MPQQVLISVAPVNAGDQHIDPRAIARDVIESAKLGAAQVHLHIRDAHGALTPDLSVFQETVRYIRQESDIIIQASTGGVSDLTIQERCAPLYDPMVETCSLNVGSVNLGEAVYLNPIQDVRYCVSEVIRQHVFPEIEVFEIGMIDTVLDLLKDYDFPKPVLFNIVLGHNGAAPATVQALQALRSFIPEGMLWGITHFGRRDDTIFAEAIRLGACTVRVGFEDSNYLNPDTQVATNAELVAHTAQLIRSLGCEVATPAQARAMLGLHS